MVDGVTERGIYGQIKRSAGYENVAMEVNKWAKIVKVRREAEQLKFPLENNEVSLKTVDKTEVVQRRTPLEQEVYSLLQGAKLVQGKKVCFLSKTLHYITFFY